MKFATVSLRFDGVFSLLKRPFLYVPVERWKPAERKASSELDLSLRSETCPLVEICPKNFPAANSSTNRREASRRIAESARSIIDSCRGFRVFVDLLHLDRLRSKMRCDRNTHPLTYFYSICQQEQRSLLWQDHMPELIPVTSFSRSTAYRAAATRIAKRLGRLCVRLGPGDIRHNKLRDRLQSLLDSCGLDPDATDLVLDLETLPKTERLFRTAESQLPFLEKWHSVTVLSGTFPQDLQQFKTVGKHGMVRDEWHHYQERVLQDSDLGNIAIFGDYTIQNPNYREPPKHCNPSASIRYALDDSWVIMKGEALRKKDGPGSKQWRAQATLLSLDDCYHGDTFSYGCRYVSEIRSNPELTGNCETWLAAMINHHLTVTTRGLIEQFRTTSADRRKEDSKEPLNR